AARRERRLQALLPSPLPRSESPLRRRFHTPSRARRESLLPRRPSTSRRRRSTRLRDGGLRLPMARCLLRWRRQRVAGARIWWTSGRQS
ncbi:hypothetical protein EMIHUDRAFT_259468, partial [Emiliania huxleyi CCMP1516]|uniref:Uncharacterized protein n=2 Tax=Emiliania huxleyi TaxID=2903 RepID=A0A0D3I0K1_EMIH1